ncbi:MAG: tetratricopeptide repeat protein [Polyangiales bacterium]
MGETRGIVLVWACAAVLLFGLAPATLVSAQSVSDDDAAREYFKAGRAAFDRADYESALTYFRHAYRTSGREALLYNIGVAADRLRRDQEALEAFERYLDTTENPTRETEVRKRLEALRKSVSEREAAERALMEAQLRSEQNEEAQKPKRRRVAPLPTAGALDTGASRSDGAVFQMPKYAAPVDQPTAKKKKWPWIVAAAAVVVAGGVTAGVVLSQRSKQSQPPSGGFAVNW